VPRPWERQPDETAQAYAAFCVYRDLGQGRSNDKAYRAAKGEPTYKGRARASWWGWSRSNRWVARAQAYDAQLQEVELKAREDEARRKGRDWARERRQQLEQVFSLSQRLVERAGQMLGFPLAEVKDDDGSTKIVPSGWRLRDAVALLEAGDRLGEKVVAAFGGDQEDQVNDRDGARERLAALLARLSEDEPGQDQGADQ
jgi:hypothetical protein